MKPHATHRRQGVALVIVLSFLVLISAIILGFFSSVTTELASSKAVANSATTRQLAESAVNVVMAQMVDATKGGTGAASLAWASQPGMIRTFDDSGSAKDFYKLYSSDKMTVSGSGFDPADDAPPTDWNSPANSELYTDLNAPGLNPQGELVYPIVDPSADGSPSPGRPDDGFKVDGFSITSSPGFDSAKTESGINNRAPMAVKWLYMLKDGTLKPPSAPSGGNVTVAGASTANPIVGRIAFWADDETAKVNINTASEGTYWDVPRIYSAEDFGQYSGTSVSQAGFSICQPTQREFQRYPGHPATTSLSAVFGGLLPVTYPYPANPTATDANKLDPYYAIAPRVGLPGTAGGGGSRGGSVQVPDGSAPVKVDTDRLYATVDELMFTPRLAGASRIPNTATGAAPGKITKGVMEKARFFITANSTAPETTLNNTPRIAVWPISTTKTAYDSLLAFCSTIGGQQYYFTRVNSRSSTTDLTPRNLRLYQYLQKLTEKDVPGFGGNFLKKYGAGATGVTDRDQILTCIFDYIRCTNLQDQSNGASPYTQLFSNGQPLGAGEVIPIKIGATQGFGRFYSITSANLLFYGTSANKMRAVFFLGFTTPQQGLACMRSNVKYKVISGLDKLEANGKSLNFKLGGTNYMDVSDLSLFHGRSVGGTESPWQAIRNKNFTDGDQGGDARKKYPFFSQTDVDVTGSPATGFVFKSTSEIVLEIRTADPDTDQLIQTMRFKFPDGTFKVPGIIGGTSATFSTRGMGGNYNNLVNNLDTVVSLQVGGSDVAANAANPSDTADDATSGDIRMVAAMPDVPANRFRADKAYKNPNVQFAHCLVQSVGEYFNGARYGKLANLPFTGVAPDYSPYKQVGSIPRQPDIPSRASAGVALAPASGGGSGDWDTGFGDQKDGAYINKPDEGDTSLQDDVGGGKRLPYMLGYGKGFASATNTYFSPNRQIPSPLMFGSIPTGIQRMLPWQTLAFHPRPEDPNHPGNKGTPKDHLLADLFWMPVVEPYAISQPFATNGKINLNYQIVPFTYIKRSTGLHAVMKATKFAALDVGIADKYKPLDRSNGGITAPNRRRSIDMTKTLAAFDTKFSNKEIFKSASQICEMNLVPPEVASAAGMAAFWNSNKLTGDNLREKPYADLYSRLTTKSNTYTVHVRVQALKKSPSTSATQWVGAKDQVLGEYRGSTILERYIDVNDPALPDFASKYASDPSDPTLNIDQYYRMRVVGTKRFSP